MNVSFQAPNPANEIRVAAGTYVYQPGQDTTSQFFGTTGVVAVTNQIVHILGGYTPGNFNFANPSANQTVIDGQGIARGVFVNGNTAEAGLQMDGFTIIRGIARGIGARPFPGNINAFGGGMDIEFAHAVLSNITFDNNQAIGNDTGSGDGGAGAGGGLALQQLPDTAQLTNIRFTNDTARGGVGPVRGGYGQGGGLFTDRANVQATNLFFRNDLAQGGATNGGGRDSSGQTGDGQGGAFNLVGGLSSPNYAVFAGVDAQGNQAIGGNAGSGVAGGAFGGAVEVERMVFTLTTSVLNGNIAQAGNGGANDPSPAVSLGGGLNAANSSVTLSQITVQGNLSQGGNGPVNKGPAGGGGIAVSSFSGYNTTANLTNCVITDNTIRMGGGSSEQLGGGGAGIWFQGTAGSVVQSTVADNFAANQSFTGEAIVLLGQGQGTPNPTTISIYYSIIAGHTSGTFSGAALYVQPGATVNLNRDLFSGNTSDDNNGSGGTFNGLASIFGGATSFVSPGASAYNYHIQTGSAAIQAASGSSVTVDRDGNPRTGTPDVGAYQRVTPLIGFTSPVYTFGEQTPTATLTLVRTGDLSGTLTISYATSDGTGVNGVDYQGVSSSVTFNPGDTSKTISFTILNNGVQDGLKTVGVSLTGLQGDPTAVFGTYKAAVFIPDATSSGNGVFDPYHGNWYLRNLNGSGAPDAQFAFGAPGWRPVIGDWSGAGAASIGVVDPSSETWYLRNENGSGGPDAGLFQFGAAGWTPITGHWSGRGRTGVGVFDPSTATFYLRNENSAGAPDAGKFQFGAGNWIPIAGDWNGDGTTTIGMFDPSTATFYLRNENSAGAPDAGVFQFGAPGWFPVVGDWDGDGKATIGVIDPSTGRWYLRNENSAGAADAGVFQYGLPGWQPVAADFNGPGGSPQLADSSVYGSGAAALTTAQLDGIFQAALERLQADGASAALLTEMRHASLVLAPQDGLFLARTVGDTIFIDPTAKGHGWFVDPTPLVDTEFKSGNGVLTAAAGTAAAGHMDLLTVVMHELGHIAKVDSHSGGNDLMSVTLTDGVRRLPGSGGDLF